MKLVDIRVGMFVILTCDLRTYGGAHLKGDVYVVRSLQGTCPVLKRVSDGKSLITVPDCLSIRP